MRLNQRRSSCFSRIRMKTYPQNGDLTGQNIAAKIATGTFRAVEKNYARLFEAAAETNNTIKNFSKTILAVLLTGLLSCGLFCQQAQARPVMGDIDFGGVVTFDTMSLATATRVNVWNIAFVLQDSGDFAT